MTEDRTLETAVPNSGTALSVASDDELRALISNATEILKERETDRMRDAVARIKALAKEHGLNVSIDRPRRKRGRPTQEARP
jgi:hypothetical protein